MTRALAFVLLVLAAFGASAPWLDRAGTAALGLALAVLVLGRGEGRRRIAPPLRVPPATVELPDETERAVRSLLDRIGDYANTATLPHHPSHASNETPPTTP